MTKRTVGFASRVNVFDPEVEVVEWRSTGELVQVVAAELDALAGAINALCFATL